MPDGQLARLEHMLAGIWRDVLGRDAVGVDEGFFDMGGTSVQMEAIRARLVVALGRPVPLVVLFEHPTIRDLAGHLAGGGPPAEDCAEPGRGGRRGRLARRRAKLLREDGP